MESSINHFLLVFDHGRNSLVELQEFGHNVNMATAAYSRAEELHRTDGLIDIVLVGSDSIETVKQTHASYFASASRTPRDILNFDPLNF